jgi:hypothetical protein
MPIGSVPCERSFSGLRRLKQWNRTAMVEYRLNGLALLHIHRDVRRVWRYQRVNLSLVEQELPTLPEHLSSSPVFIWVRVTRSLDSYVCFVDRRLSLYFFFWPLCCLFFDIRILINPGLLPKHSRNLLHSTNHANRIRTMWTIFFWFEASKAMEQNSNGRVQTKRTRSWRNVL